MQTYSHSGAVPIVGALGAVFCGLAVAAVGGFIYAYEFLWIPIIYINILYTLGYAAAVGFTAAFAARLGKVRNTLFVTAVAAGCMLVGIWIYWGAYVWAIAPPGVGLWAWSPDVILAFGAHLYENGSWSMREGEEPITGWFLVTFWVAEIAALMVVAVAVSRADSARPFCESCREWTNKESGVARLAATGNEPIWSQIAAGDLLSLAQFRPAEVGAMQFVRLDLSTCPKCRQSNFLTIANVLITIDKKGKAQEKQTNLLVNGVVTPAQVEIVRLCQSAWENRSSEQDESEPEPAQQEDDSNGEDAA